MKSVKSPQRRSPQRRLVPAGLLERARRVRGRVWGIGAAGVAAAVTAAALLWPGGGPEGPPDPRARVYKDFDACLLTGTGGIRAGSPAAPVWKGMQDASAETLVRVSYLEVIGEQTKQNALPFLNSLVQRQCDVVLAVGAAQVDAAEAEAKHHPEVRFVVVGGEAVAANVTAAGPGDHLSSAVAEVVTGAYQGSL